MKDAIRECYSTVIRELAAIVNAPQTDDMLEKELLPRDPVMENVSRIREAMDKLSAAQHADARGGEYSIEYTGPHTIQLTPMSPEPPTAATHEVASAAYRAGFADGKNAATTDAGREDAPVDSGDNADFIEHCAAKLTKLGLPITGCTLDVIAKHYRTLTPAGGEDGFNTLRAFREVRSEFAIFGKHRTGYEVIDEIERRVKEMSESDAIAAAAERGAGEE